MQYFTILVSKQRSANESTKTKALHRGCESNGTRSRNMSRSSVARAQDPTISLWVLVVLLGGQILEVRPPQRVYRIPHHVPKFRKFREFHWVFFAQRVSPYNVFRGLCNVLTAGSKLFRGSAQRAPGGFAMFSALCWADKVQGSLALPRVLCFWNFLCWNYWFYITVVVC